jgi:demethylmenaquinone methyltransferase / 2-methoxy-6-polyprenyl-1,4-benzoquinol methylase
MSEESPRNGAIASEREVRRMFDRIAPRYDLMNRLMTGGQDRRWRRKVVKLARETGGCRALDVATGTGDLALGLAEGGFSQVIGLDFAPEMIALANRKAHDEPGIAFVVGDAMRLPFVNGAFDACTIAFGLRNCRIYEVALQEMERVLAPGGRLVVLELTPYRKPVLGRLFHTYFSRVVPLVGGWLTGDSRAYQYLPASVAAFPTADALTELLRRAGFSRVEVKVVGGGTVAIHIADKE